jgi:hypothetical protein
VTQVDVVRSWWADLDPVDQGRVLRLEVDDLLPEDLAVGLALAGVTVVPLDASPVDGRPAGYVPPDVLVALLGEVRGR